ncbi:MAG: flagellar biosynthesis protein FlgD [Planctomycetota bacterium]|nr:flagellar biosynthesis protein FlgD [Planctomycetota bacterium]
MIQGLASTDPITGAAAPGTQALDKDAFMQLLVAQLKNQDPMAPTDNQEFIAQLAQFSSLEEMQGVNENLVALAYLQEGNAMLGQLTNSSALIGKQVTYSGEDGSEQTGVVDAVKLVNSQVMLSIGGEDVPLTALSGVSGNEGAGDDGGQDDSGDEDGEA